MNMHHKVFQKFRCYQGEVRAGFVCDFLGVMTRIRYCTGLPKDEDEYNEGTCINTTYPAFSENYFEWIDLLEAVIEAKDCFTMIELGAGYGRWLCRAAAAVRQYNDKLSYRLIGVEAEPTHFQWMKEHLLDNNVGLEKCKLFEAAVYDKNGRVRFHVGKADEWYGQSISLEDTIGTSEVKAISLSTLLGDLNIVDLIDLDIQGSEFIVLSVASKDIDAKVKRVHIATHYEQNEEKLRKLFTGLGWHNKNNFSLGKESQTEYGRIYFQDGVQSWINPKFVEETKFEEIADGPTQAMDIGSPGRFSFIHLKQEKE